MMISLLQAKASLTFEFIRTSRRVPTESLSNTPYSFCVLTFICISFFSFCLCEDTTFFCLFVSLFEIDLID